MLVFNTVYVVLNWMLCSKIALISRAIRFNRQHELPYLLVCSALYVFFHLSHSNEFLGHLIKFLLVAFGNITNSHPWFINYTSSNSPPTTAKTTIQLYGYLIFSFSIHCRFLCSLLLCIPINFYLNARVTVVHMSWFGADDDRLATEKSCRIYCELKECLILLHSSFPPVTFSKLNNN